MLRSLTHRVGRKLLRGPHRMLCLLGRTACAVTQPIQDPPKADFERWLFASVRSRQSIGRQYIQQFAPSQHAIRCRLSLLAAYYKSTGRNVLRTQQHVRQLIAHDFKHQRVVRLAG